LARGGYYNNNNLANAYFANAFGGGLTGAYLASNINGGSVFNDYVGANALSNPASSNLYLYSSLGNGGGGFGSTLGTYFDANAYAANPTQYDFAALSSPYAQGNIQSAYLANAFGGGITGAYLANSLSGNGGYGNNGGYYGNGGGWYY